MNRASTGLCGGCRATGIPTATHAGVRADVVRGMPVGIPAWQAKRLLHAALDKVHHLRRRPLRP